MSIETIETLLIIFIVLIQLWVFWKTKRQIKIFKDSIPETSLINVSKIYLTAHELNTIAPEQILGNISSIKNVERVKGIETSPVADITIIECSKNENEVFEKILYSINIYLLRNSGATSDFN